MPEETLWLDELNWSNIKASANFTLSGKLIVNQTEVYASGGRPITLGGDNCWIKRSDLEILLGWSNVIDKQMTLTLHDSRIFQVGFKLWDPPVIEIEDLRTIADLTSLISPDEALYRLTLKLALV